MAEIFGPERLEQLRAERRREIQESMKRHPAKTGVVEAKTGKPVDTRGRGIQGLIEDARMIPDESFGEEGELMGVGFIDQLMNLTQEQRDVVRALWDEQEANSDTAWWPNSEDQQDDE